MRIHRALARSGVASRRAAEALVEEGRVTVNGEAATVGQVVDPSRDEIRVDGTIVRPPPSREAVWIVLNKPPGFLSTRSDESGRPTVFDLIPDVPGLTYVGRLDYLTEGLMLFTTDGDAAHRLSHPSAEVSRTYVVHVRGDAESAARHMRAGVELDDGWARPRGIHVTSLGRHRWEIELTINEGRTREVRRICEAVGLEVERLIRTRFGPVLLGTLPPGEHRPLRFTEIAGILTIVK